MGGTVDAVAPTFEQPIQETVIKHQLEEEPELKPVESDLIETTSYIRNFNVFYEEVIPEVIEEKITTYNEDEFIIIESNNVLNDIEVIDAEVVAPKTVEEDQFSLSFDMPLAQEEEKPSENTIVFDLSKCLLRQKHAFKGLSFFGKKWL